jgi:acyl-CoA dehydrogenase
MDEQVYPNERRFYEEVAEGDRWQPLRLIEELKAKARSAGLWNLFLPASARGAGLSNTEYAPLCEIMGRVLWAAEVFNCSAPDTGNMETLERYATEEQKKRWLDPLLEGRIRSASATEPVSRRRTPPTSRARSHAKAANTSSMGANGGPPGPAIRGAS